MTSAGMHWKEERMAVSIDADIQRAVQDELKWDSRLQPNEIGIAVKDGVVTLFGYVDSYLKKLAANEAALRVQRVKAVANDIQVRLPGTSERTDTDLARAAREALQWDVEVPADKVKVTISNGWVSLAGEVEYAFQKQAAERVAKHLAGVTGVSNLIAVKPRAAPANIKQEIQRALVRAAALDSQRIQVEVQGSKVILRGLVSSYTEKAAAERIAWSQPGVIEVENLIAVA
jgi:osmotically-inducible protein OsmY